MPGANKFVAMLCPASSAPDVLQRMDVGYILTGGGAFF